MGNPFDDDAGWPTFIHRLVRDFPLEPEERVVFYHITSRAGWDGDWCDESAAAMAEALMMSDRDVRYRWQFLAKANLVERQPNPGFTDKFRPRKLALWENPDHLPAIRAEIYKHRKIQRNDKVVLLATARQARAQPDLPIPQTETRPSYKDFQLTPELHEWAQEHCPQVVHIDRVFHSFMNYLDRQHRENYGLENVDLADKWKWFMGNAQRKIENQMKEGRAHAARFGGGKSGKSVEAGQGSVRRFGTGGE